MSETKSRTSSGPRRGGDFCKKDRSFPIYVECFENHGNPPKVVWRYRAVPRAAYRSEDGPLVYAIRSLTAPFLAFDGLDGVFKRFF